MAKKEKAPESVTEAGIQSEKERQERQARWAKMAEEDEADIEDRVADLDNALEELKEEFNQLLEQEELENLEGDPCFSCDKLVPYNELIELSSQYHCPYCGEGWVEMDNRPDEEAEE